MTLPRVELLADRSDSSWVSELVVALRAWSEPRAPHPGAPHPDAYLAVSPHAAGLDAAIRSGIPVAVITESAPTISDVIREGAQVIVVRDPRDANDAPDVVVWPRDAVNAALHPSISPFVRQRWRSRLGLPEPWVLELDGHRSTLLDPGLVPSALALCSAAVVTSGELTLALALGTAVVTSPATAARVGAEADVQVLVRQVDRLAAARELADDFPRAAALGWGARLLVEERFDLGRVAIDILDGLGIGPAPFPRAPLAGLDAELAALGTPSGSSVANRIIRKAAALAPGADWADLTGRRR